MARVSPSFINNDFYFEKIPKARLSKANVPNGNNTGVTLSYTSICVIVGCVTVIVVGTLIGSLLLVAQDCKTGHGEQQNKVDGGWTLWSEWRICTKTCGVGTQARTRLCNEPGPAHNGYFCPGQDTDQQNCSIQGCPVDGGWTLWSEWRICTKTCGVGTQARTRLCNEPGPAHNGYFCPGQDTDQQNCSIQGCPVDGGWTLWSEWGTCTKTCGVGTQARTRLCNVPEPAHNGYFCPGQDTDQQNCSIQGCPVDGGWTLWSEWGTCTKTCGVGTQARTRLCNEPEPAHNGYFCPGQDTDQQNCSIQGCPGNGGWSAWTGWGTCTKSCGTGTQIRSRTCSSPAPSHDGAPCSGSDTGQMDCNTQNCPEGDLHVDLEGTGGVTGSLSGYSIVTGPTNGRNGRSCSKQAVLKVTFSKLSQYEGVCWSGAYGSRQMLKIQMYFSDKGRDSWMFDIGDSVSNNGWAGDGYDSDFSAEVQGFGTTISAWANTRQPETLCKAQQLSSFADSLSSSVKVVTVYVANHFLKVTNDQGLSNTSCDECLYGLNGQYDKRAGGTGNEDIYLAFNRVVYYDRRNGYGLCSVKIQWVTDPHQ